MKNKGFTLIELIVVIVILGILAVTAVPKYIDIKADAQTSVLHGVKAAMEGAAALVYGKSVVKGNHKIAATNNPKPTVTLTGGTEVKVDYGFPTSTITDWQDILDLSTNDFKMKVTTSGVLIIYPTFLGIVFSTTADCIVTYQPATASSKPIITVNPCV